MVGKRTNGKIQIDCAFATENTATFVTNVRGRWYATVAKEVEECIFIEKCSVNMDLIPDNNPESLSGKKEMKARAMAVMTLLAILVESMAITVAFKNSMIISMLIVFFIDVTLWNCSILKYFSDLWLKVGNKRTRRLQAAMNKTINAYTRLEIVPNRYIVQEYSSYIENFFYIKNSIGIVTLIIMFSVGWLNIGTIEPEKMFLEYLIMLFFCWIVYNTGICKYLKWYLVKKPVRCDLSMAIFALDEHVKFINNLLENEDEAVKDITRQIDVTIDQMISN